MRTTKSENRSWLVTRAEKGYTRTSNTSDELVMDFGLNMPMQTPGQPPVVVFSVGSRIVMNWAGAKRLAMSIGGAVRQYEERFGEIDINPKQPGDMTPPSAN